MYADSILSAVLQAESLDAPTKQLSRATKLDRMHFKVNISSPYISKKNPAAKILASIFLLLTFLLYKSQKKKPRILLPY